MCWFRRFAFIALFGVMAQAANAEVINCDFASVVGGSIQFTGTGDTITFPNTGTYDFLITDSTAPSLVGLFGNIGGTFTVGTITSPVAGFEQASVSTSNGTLQLWDGASQAMTADLDWFNVAVFADLFGALGTGSANLTNFTYAGTDSDLLAFANGYDQTAVLTFQFSANNKHSLTELMMDGQVTNTSYSGSLSAIPEPSSFAIFVTALLSLLACGWRRRRG